MTNYKFDISNNKPSEEEIEKKKDFKRLKHRYSEVTKPQHKTKLYKYKNRRVFLALMLILVVLFLIVLSEQEQYQ